MIKPNPHQLEVADAALATSLTEAARQHGISVERVRQIALRVARYREWHAVHVAELDLPLAARRVEFIGFSKHTTNALIWDGIETGEQLATLNRKTVLATPAAGPAAWREIEAYLGVHLH